MRQLFNSSFSNPNILFSTIGNAFQSTRSFQKENLFSFLNFKFDKRNLPKLLLVGFGILLVLAIIFTFLTSNNNNASSNNRPLAPVALKTEEIKKEFSFPIRDEKGKELSKMKYEVQKASIQDEILVKGQRARAVEGRVFLILDIKISNSFDQGLQINSKDYVRLIIDGNKEELIAADIHNDPVEVQAISTKTTRIGFPIDEADKNLEIQVGEINGKKETIKLTVNN